MILVYTGNGKGKTSACVGQAMRAHGRGLAVAFAQFMKRSDQAGEQVVLRELLGARFFAGGRGFFRREEDRPAHRAAALAVLAWAEAQLPEVDLLVLDESLYALGSDLLTVGELQSCIAAARERGAHLVLSGRGLPDWLRESADLITEMCEVRHPHGEKNAGPIPGIEY